MRVVFQQLGRSLYQDDLDVVPRKGDRVLFPSGNPFRVIGPPLFVLEERPLPPVTSSKVTRVIVDVRRMGVE